MGELSKKTFTKAEIDKLLYDVKQEYDNRLKQQKNRIFDLVNEIKVSKTEVENLKKRDALISKALLLAVQKAKEIEHTAKRKSENEIIRLQNFIQRCEKYLLDIKLKYPVDNNISKFEEFTDKMKGAFMPADNNGQQNGNDEFAVSEDFNPKEKINEYIKSDNGFNMEDVLNPKHELNLEELCRKLGLMD